jgi:aspartate aminotransferase
MAVTLSAFASSLTTEKAFDVLAVARRLKATGKDVIELQIGDSPYPSSSSALSAVKRALDAGATRYGPSLGLPEFREVIAETVQREIQIPATGENVVVGIGAKIFQTFFCEAFLEPGDEVLIFSPHFATYEPNILRRGATARFAPLSLSRAFRPDPQRVEEFLRTAKRPRAIFLNSPHNPTGGVAKPEDYKAIADLVRGRNVAVFSDEPYCHMVWDGVHHSFLAQPEMLDQSVGAFTFSKSYSMSGWRLGYAIANREVALAMGKMVNTSLSCVPPMIQWAGMDALKNDAGERDATMAKFRAKVELLVTALRQVPGVEVLMPSGTFYVFPNVQTLCDRLGITSHGLAMFLLEGADDHKGVACLGGECFGEAGRGFLRFSCAEPDHRLLQAVEFLAEAVTRTEQVKSYLTLNPEFQTRMQ